MIYVIGFVGFVGFIVFLLLLLQISSLKKALKEALIQAGEAGLVAQARAAEYLKREEARMRADAIKRSGHVVTGKVAEQVVPFGPEFTFNCRDCRFLGSPIDFIVFEGLTEGHLERIVLVEVKTGRSRLSGREKQVQDAVRLGEVDYEVLRVGK